MPPSRRQNGAASSSSSSSKATPISLAFDAKLRSSLAHLPPSVYSALVARDIAPQNIVLQVTRRTSSPATSSEDEDDDDEHNGKDAPRHTVFVGWSGQSSNIESTLVLSSSMANLFLPTAQPSSSSSSSSSAYTLTLLRSPPLPTATRVDLTPLTPDDWELLSQNAGAVEDDMLSQVRSVCTGGRVCIFVGRGAIQECWFTVDATEPQTASSSQHRKQQAAAAAAAHPRAVRLTTDTEIVIAPRTRQSQAAAAAAQAHDISSSKGASQQQQQLNGALAARARVKNRVYKVLPDSLRPTFSDLQAQLPDLNGDASIVVLADHEADDDDGEADEEEQEETRSDWSLLARAYGSGEKQSWGRVTLTIQPCPSAPATRPMEATSTSSTTDSPPSAETSARSPPPKRPTTTAYIVKGAASLGDGRAWPKRWIWLNSAAREKLGGVGPGETVCFSAPPPSSVSPPPTASEQQQLESGIAPPAPEMPGCAVLLETVESHIINATTSSAASSSSSNILLHGPSGVGKTLLLHTLAKRLRPHLTTTLYVDCTPLSELRLSQLKTTFREWRNALDWYAQSGGAVLMLDNLDKVLIAEVENVDPSRARALAECFVQNLCDSPAGARQEDEASSSSSLVLATTNSSTSFHKLLVEKHVWAESMSMKPPGKQERSEVLQHLVAEKAKSSTTRQGEGGEAQKEHGAPATGIEADPSLNYVLLAAQTEGYLPADLVDLVDRAIYRAVVRVGGEQEAAKHDSGKGSPQQPLRLTLADFTSAQENFTPISLRSLSLSSSGTTSWSSIGGLHATRRVLRETLEFPSRYAQIFASCPLRLRSGLLLYGYPGCGKTMLASAVAKECGANFVSVKGPEILNKYIGASEKSVRDLFERASAAKPCVLFFDEFDSIAPKRGHDSTGVTDRVVNQLLTQMDGAEGLSGVYVLAATSRPDLIDSALLRPGRLDKSLLCDLPDEDDRVDILVAVAREGKIEIEDEGEGGWARQWAKKTPGFSGADLQALVYNAHLEVVHEGIEATAAANGGNDGGEDDGEAGGPLEFAEVVGSSSSGDDGSTSTSTRRSGAEEQALRRRLELALTNSRAQQHQRPGRRAAPPINGAAASSSSATPTHGHRLVTSAHLSRSLAGLRPSVPEAERVRLARIYREFAGGKERGEEGFASGEGSREVGARESLM